MLWRNEGVWRMEGGYIKCIYDGLSLHTAKKRSETLLTYYWKALNESDDLPSRLTVAVQFIFSLSMGPKSPKKEPAWGG
jgi:hypothetical protein